MGIGRVLGKIVLTKKCFLFQHLAPLKAKKSIQIYIICLSNKVKRLTEYVVQEQQMI